VTYGSVPTSRTEIERRVVRRAWADPEFRERLRQDGRAALAEELGVELPKRLQVVVVEERPDLLCIVVPVDLSQVGDRAAAAMTGRPPPTLQPGEASDIASFG